MPELGKPLDPSTLSADAQRALSSSASKMMAARGLAPLSDGRDLLSVLYQCSVDSDSKLRAAATKSAGDLPPTVLIGALARTDVDARVLDFFGRAVDRDSKSAEVVILNPTTAGETIAWIASVASEGEVELIASNQQRLLSHPDIIGAMYKNRRARMSTVDRAVELAIRNDVKVDGIPAWDELKRELLSSGKKQLDEGVDANVLDQMFASAAHVNETRAEDGPGEPEEAVAIQNLPMGAKIRLATVGNSFDRAILIRDPKKAVAVAAVKSPGMTDAEAAKYASNSTLCEDVIDFIGKKREWTRLYPVKKGLVSNPKCPLPTAMRLLPHLHEKDVRVLARSKGVPSALAAQAKKLVSQRSRRGGSRGKR